MGRYPIEAVRSMAEFAEVAEEAEEIFHGGASGASRAHSAVEAVMFAAVDLADDAEASALIIPTSTGGYAACLLEVPAAPADRRPRPQGARGQPARARVGGLPGLIP